MKVETLYRWLQNPIWGTRALKQLSDLENEDRPSGRSQTSDQQVRSTIGKIPLRA